MRTRLRSKVTLLFIVCVALLAVGGTAMALVTDTSGNTAPAPTIQSDKDDYKPGETVTLTGSNWQPGESVHININDDQGQTWSRNVDVTADASGNITDQFQLPNSFVALYKVTATGAQSGVATTSFTDGNVGIRNASTTPAGLQASYKFEGFNSTDCTGTAVASRTKTFSITGPGLGSTPAGQAQVASGNNESVKVSITAVTPATQEFKEWNHFDGNTVSDGVFFDTDGNAGTNDRQQSFCFATQNSTNKTFVGLFQLANRAPVAVNDSLTTNEDTPGSVNVLTNDTDADNDTLTVSNNTNGANGSVSCTTAGVCTYTPNGNFNGSDSFTYTASDGKGGTATGTVNVTVTAVNDAPSFTKGANQTVNEDSGAHSVTGWATAISSGPANESSQALDFIVSNDNNSLFTATGQPQVSANGTLSYTLAADASGSATVTVKLHDDGGTANGGVDTSAEQTFTITVNSVNDAPSFTKGANQTVNEDAGAQTVNGWATAISAGPNESGQTVQFMVTNDNNGLFAAGGQPSVAPNGTLTYTPAADKNGSATVTIKAKDNGGTANGGVDESASQTFTITINSVNDKPSFTSQGNDQVNEDSGPRTVTGWVTNFNPGPADESTQNVADYIISDAGGNPVNSNLFTNTGQPDVSNNGTLTYTPAPDAHGSITIKVKVRDDGGTANGGVDTSDAQDLTITINPVNDAPSFTKGDNQTVNEDAAAQSVPNWATAISAGPNESGQTVQFMVTNDNNSLFSAGPAVSSDGTLSYTPADNAFGTATVTINAKDNGGTANGGDDTSETKTFTITVTAVNDEPSFTAGANQTVDEDSGAHSVAWATNIKAGPADESGQALNFVVTNDNNSLFSNQPAIAPDGTLTYTPADNANGTATVSVTLKDNGGTANGGDDTSETKTFTITVNSVNDAPVVTFTDPTGETQTLDEDKTTTRLYKYTVTDVDNANPTVTESCGSGGSLKPDESGDPTQDSFRCLFADNATTTVSATANDGESTNNTGSDSIAVTVNNVAPKVNLTGPTTANEGDTKTYTFTITDPGADTFNFPTGYPTCGAHGNLVGTPATGDGQFQCTFPDGDNFTDVAVKVADDDGGVSVADTEHVEIITVEVANVAPSVTAAANQSSKEGESKLFSLGSFSDPGTDSPWAVDVDWGDGSAHETFTETATGPATAKVITAKSHTYADEGTGTYTVTVKVTDKNNVSDTKTFTVNVSNENPTASNPSFVFNSVLGTATAGFDFSDVGYLDTHGSSYFTWSGVGDTGNRPATVSAQENVAPDATGKASDTRTLNPGCYNLTVTGTAKDNDGGTSAPLTLYSNSQQTSVYAKGFLPPIMDNERNIAKYGNVVPVKVQLTNPCTGGTVTSESLFITVAKGLNGEFIEDVNTIATSVSAADSGSQMRVADGGYIFNLSTKNLSANADWAVRVRLGSTTGPVLLQAVLYPKK